MKEGGLDGLPHLQYTNFQGLSDKKSVIVSPVFTVYTLNKGEIKTVSVLKRLPNYLVPWRSLNWQKGWGRENSFGCIHKLGCDNEEAPTIL